MAKKYCDYQDCRNVRNTHGNITFFSLPTDERRIVWIENSGNEELKLISDKTIRFLCEKHFERKYLRHQFSRSTLSKSAIPLPYKKPTVEQNTQEEEQATQYNMLFNKDLQNNDCVFVLKPPSSINECEDLENPINSVKYNIVLLNDGINTNYLSNKEEVIHNDVSNSNCSLNDEEPPFTAMSSETEFLSLEDFEILGKHPSIEKHIEERTEPISKKIRLDNIASSDSSDLSNSSYEITSSTLESNKANMNNNGNSTKISNTVSKRCLNNDNMNVENEELNIKSQEINSISFTKENYEEDMHFALSLVGNFQRLPLKKKALAKVKILQYLVNLEFNDSELLNI